eukprot:1324211-Prymnesium_polylepis.1
MNQAKRWRPWHWLDFSLPRQWVANHVETKDFGGPIFVGALGRCRSTLVLVVFGRCHAKLVHPHMHELLRNGMLDHAAHGGDVAKMGIRGVEQDLVESDQAWQGGDFRVGRVKIDRLVILRPPVALEQRVHPI